MMAGLVAAAFVLVVIALLFVPLGYRVWRVIHLTAVSVPFQDEQVFSYAFAELMRTFWYRAASTAEGRRVYQPGPWKQFVGMAPVTVELSGQGSARVIGPASLIRLVRRQFRAAVDQPYAGPQPWGTWLKGFAKVGVLLLVTLGPILSLMFFVAG